MMAGDSDPPGYTSEPVVYREKETSQFKDPYPRSREDGERAEAVIETLWRDLNQSETADVRGQLLLIRGILYKRKTFLMEVFRAVRGELA